MANPKVPGRMLRRSIATSRGVARLGPEATAIFCMIIPHLDAYGKMLGDPAVVKETALPLAKWATVEIVGRALRDISRSTNLKWWKDADGRRYLHAIHFDEHQDLRTDRRGGDHLPSYPGASPKEVPDSVRESLRELVRPEVEVEVKKKEKKKLKCADAPSPPSEGGGGAVPKDNGNGKSVVDGNGAELPPHVVADINRLSQSARETVFILLSDFRRGTVPREEAIAAARPKLSRQSIATLFPAEATG